MKRFIEKSKLRWWSGIAIGVLVGLAAGFLLGGGEPSREQDAVDRVAEAAAAQVWTCSMHPQIRMPGPGPCPICAMDLIPLEAEDGGAELGPRQLRLSAAARQLAGVQVSPAQRQFVQVEARMVGKIAYDETRLRHISAWIPGRIDRLYVDYTGVPVAEGDHVAQLYSPDLLTAQEELIQALRAVEKLNGDGTIAETAREMVKSTREKLRLLGLKAAQIAAIERERVPADHVTIFAPTGGVVVEKHVREGAYVQTGTRIYTIADLTQVWLHLDAYESDLLWVHYGQEVEFSTEAYPGERFRGRVAFISPVLDEGTRTVKVRVNVSNEEGRLKPGMFVRAQVRARVANQGRVMDPQLAGKWISPMHPEIVRDGPGNCDICGMQLIRAEELGYVSADATQRDAPLVVPASAVLLTGRRAVVYVAVDGREGVFEGRELTLGPRAGDYYVVEEGLRAGEMVVTNGSFKIDSALQIQAKPSMMNPQGGSPSPGHRRGGESEDAHAGHGHSEIEESGDGHGKREESAGGGRFE